MIIRNVGIALAALSITTSSAALAQDEKKMATFVAIEEKNIASGKAKIDPAYGYIYNHGTLRFNGMFLKVPDEQDIKEYEAEWQKKFVKAREKSLKRLKEWESDVAVAKKSEMKPPEKPVEVTEENFSIGDLETRTRLIIGPQYVFSKADGYSYLSQVQPGTYIYYGQLLVGQNGGYAGTCACMGTIKFTVKPGVITNLGDIFSQISFDNFGIPVKLKPDYKLPASLEKYPNENGEVFAYGKLDNFFGIMIDRLAPIEGVMAYELDKVVDLKATAAAATAGPATEAVPADVAATPATAG